MKTERFNCPNCMDTGLAWTDETPGTCGLCRAVITRNRAAKIVAETVSRRMEKNRAGNDGNDIAPLAFFMARTLTLFTAANPCPRLWLEKDFQLNERQVKAFIEILRKDWLLPIGSSKGQPNGYWIITSADEFNLWNRQYRRQALSEFGTAYRVMRQNFPELAGQTPLDFFRSHEHEFEEAVA